MAELLIIICKGRFQSLTLQNSHNKTYGLLISFVFPILAVKCFKALVFRDREEDEKSGQKRRPVNVMLFMVVLLISQCWQKNQVALMWISSANKSL